MKLAGIFTDHAVLQREIAIPVWGWTEPQILVTATLGSVSAATRSGADGRFILRLPAFSAGGPYTLTVSAGNSTVKVQDLWIGEVWVASGQSNMQWTLSQCDQQGEIAIRNASGTPIRMITIPRLAHCGRQSNVTASWMIASPETAGNFSAVAYHFARKLYDQLQVPIGIIDSSWGGTIVETWTSREGLITNRDTRAWTERYEANLHAPGFWPLANGSAPFSYPADPGNEGVTRGWAALEFEDSGWSKMFLPQIWQTAGHNYSGIFWFRLTVDLPADWAGKELSLKIGAVDKQDTTYFNGMEVGATGTGLETEHWNIPRNYTVPGSLVKAGRNVIAVRAYSFVYAGGMIGPENQMSLTPTDKTGTALPLAGSWRYTEEKNLGLVQLPTPPMGPGNPNSPYMLYDNMIHPLLPYAIRGAIWYQGESNAGNARQYQGMLTTMIRDWRRAWGQGDFPFIQVQLANYTKASNYQEESPWARLREAQLFTCREPETGMGVAIDVGEAGDIHPKNKKDVGERLAQWALVKTYHRAGIPSGPLYQRMTIEGNAIRLHFECTGSGLVAKGRVLTHFVVAGSNRAFHPAEARIEHSTILVQSAAVNEPVAVRYAWAENPEGCNLYNKEGLPASPFRTDTW